MPLDDYNPATALTAYYPDRDERRTARLWAIEKLAHDLAEVGIIELFEGPGTDPTVLTGYGIGKMWLHVSSGVTETAGMLRIYDGGGDAADIANWPAVTADLFRSYLTEEQPSTVIASDTTIYVRSDGNNGNNGLTDSAGGAFQTWQAAINWVQARTLKGVTVTIQHGSEIGLRTFSEALSISALQGVGVLHLRGAGRTATLLSSAGETFDIQNANGVQVKLSNMKATAAAGGTGGHIVKVNYKSLVAIDANFEFGSAAGNHIWVHDNQSCVQILSCAYYISGDADAHLFVQNHGHVFLEAATINLVGTPNFRNAFAYGYLGGTLQYVGNTVVGSATGRRFIEYAHATINLNGLSENVLPGSVAGLRDYRTPLAYDTTLYIRSDGNDANNGSQDSAAHAIKTWAQAAFLATQYDLNGFTLTFQHGSEAGTVTFTAGAAIINLIGAGNLKFRGNGSTTVISTSGLCLQQADSGVAAVIAENLKLTSSGAGLVALSGNSTFVVGAGVEFGVATGAHISASGRKSQIDAISKSYTISGGGTAHIECLHGARAQVVACSPTLTGTPAFSNGFLFAYGQAQIDWYSNSVTGSATGVRRVGNWLSFINLNGAAESTVPGNSAGSSSNGSVYNGA